MCFYYSTRPIAIQDFQKGGLCDPAQGVGAGGRVPTPHQGRSSGDILFFESLRMALVHYKYIQLSGSIHALPVCSRSGHDASARASSGLAIYTSQTRNFLIHAIVKNLHIP